MDLPEEWSDDQTMNVLFSPFRERQVNQASWDKKMKFWTELILRFCQSKNKISFNTKDLPKLFERNGKIPMCLSKVQDEMMRTGHLAKRADFKIKDSSSWSAWGFDMLVKKPTSWAFSTFVKNPMSWTVSRVTGSSSSDNEASEEVVVVSILKERAERLFEAQQATMENDRTDSIIGYDQLYERHKALVPDRDDFHLVLIQLCNENKCVLFQTNSHEKVVRFAKKNKRSVTPPSDADGKIYKLKLAESTLQHQIDKLSNEMNKLRVEAKHWLNEGDKQAAKACLRRKKRCEVLKEQKVTSLDNIQHILTAVAQADSNKMVLDAYSSGSEAFKQLQDQHGVRPGQIEDVMIDLEQTFEDHDEINRSMAAPDLDPELADLEYELDAILAEVEDDDTSAGRVPQLSGLAAEGGRVPHQQLMDAMCSMRLHTDDTELFELPDTPKFDPLSPAADRSSVKTRHDAGNWKTSGVLDPAS